MGKPTGFMEYQRKTGNTVAPLERIKNFKEFHLQLPKKEQQMQAARCMACGVPFCQAGTMIAGMASGCPLQNLVPEWNDLVYLGNYEQAYRRLTKTNCFPEFTSRVCPALCEAACTCNVNGDPVCTKENERAIIENAWATGLITPQPPKVRTGKRVAVVGSGPSGLAAAMQLNRRGHSVTVFERRDRVGGLLRYGIPNMKLDKSVIDRRVDLMKAEGIEFVTNADIGKDVKADKLLKEFDRVLLCCGAANPRDIKAEGRDAKGIYFAVDFLTSVTKSLLDSNFEDHAYIDAKGKHVVVIGGGDTGNDCVGTSIRLGAKKVIIAYRRRQDDMTALPEEIEGAIAEGAELYGLKAPHHIEADAEGNVAALWAEPQIIGPIDAWGRARPIHADVELERIPCDVIVVAIGQGIELRPFEEAGIKIKRGTISALSSSELANNEGVFAGGDCVTGPATVIRAIAAGKVAAANIDEYLGYNHTISCDVVIPDPSIDDKRPCGRIQMHETEAGERKHTFEPIECGMTKQEACQEAGRCLRCDKFGFSTLKGGRTLKW